MTINLNSPDDLAALRKEAESWAKTYPPGADATPSGEWTWLSGRCHPGVVVTLLDALHEARTAYLKLHQHDLQIACNEREPLRARVKELEAALEAKGPKIREALNGFDAIRYCKNDEQLASDAIDALDAVMLVAGRGGRRLL